jgi:prepilin-type processing-associated H-X9-DG protein
VQPYLKSVQILQCPSDSAAQTSDPATNGYSDYAYNTNLNKTGDTNGNIYVDDYTPASLAFVENSTLTLLAMDNGTQTSRNTLCGAAVSAGSNYSKYGTPGQARHLDGAVFLFCDGHVKWYKMPEPKGELSDLIFNRHVRFEVSKSSPTFHVNDSIGYGASLDYD